MPAGTVGASRVTAARGRGIQRATRVSSARPQATQHAAPHVPPLLSRWSPAMKLTAFLSLLIVAAVAVPVTLADDVCQPGAPMKGASVGADRAVNTWAWTRYNGTNLRYEQPRYGTEARLYVRDTSVPAGAWRVYRGSDLEAIVTENVALQQHNELAALQTHVYGSSSPSTTYPTPNGTIYEYDPATRSARLFTRTDGGEVVYMGTDLDTILRAQPDLAKRDGMVEFQAGVRDMNSATTSLRMQPGIST